MRRDTTGAYPFERTCAQTIAWAAQRLGATETQARGLARLQFATGYPQLPERYRSGHCIDGGAGDLRPDDPRWP